MKWRGPIVSLVVHGAVGAVVLLLIGGGQGGPLHQYMTFAEVREPRSSARSAPAPEPTAVRAARRPPAAPRPRVEQAREAAHEPSPAEQPPVHDFGLVLEGSGELPPGAVALPLGASVTEDAVPAPAASRTQPGAGSGAKPKTAASAQVCREPLQPPRPTLRTSLAELTQSRPLGARGRLVLRIHVDAEGSVERTQVEQSVDPGLDADVSQAVRSWRFAPAVQCGVAVAGTYRLAIRFED